MRDNNSTLLKNRARIGAHNKKGNYMNPAKIAKNLSLTLCGPLLAGMLLEPNPSAGQAELAVMPSGANIALQWQQTADNYALETTTNATDPTGWEPSPGVPFFQEISSDPPTCVGSVSNVPVLGNRFFRLRRLDPPAGPAPTIANQPFSRLVHETPYFLTDAVSAPAQPGVSYQWLKDDGTGLFFPMLGQTNAVLLLAGAGVDDNGSRFLCMLTSSNGLVTFSSVVTLGVVRAGPGSVAGWGDQAAPPLSNLVAISSGSVHGLALTTNGAVIGWGTNTDGQLTIPELAAFGVAAVSAGKVHSLALKDNGTVLGWGNNDFGQATPPTGLCNVVQIAAGDNFSVGLGDRGAITVWGGDPSYGLTNVPPGLKNVVGIAAGGSHILAVQADGTVGAWGNNSDGQTDVPPGLSGVRAVAAGGRHSLALLADGTVRAWGDNSYGQTHVPPNLRNVTAIAASATDSLSLLADQSVVVWGDNTSGQTNVPSSLTNVVAIAGASGGFHSVALTSP